MNNHEQYPNNERVPQEIGHESLESVSNQDSTTTQESIPHIDREAVQKRDEGRLARVRALLGLPVTKLKEVGGKIKEWINKETLPESNILYRPDRMYRCIGTQGYQDFLETGVVRSKNRKLYLDTSFNEGAPSPNYMKGASGAYILEALSDATEFSYKTHPFSGEPMKDISYRGTQNGALTKDSAVRIFERVEDGVYRVVFDNINDQALVEEVQE